MYVSAIERPLAQRDVCVCVCLCVCVQDQAQENLHWRSASQMCVCVFD